MGAARDFSADISNPHRIGTVCGAPVQHVEVAIWLPMEAQRRSLLLHLPCISLTNRLPAAKG